MLATNWHTNIISSSNQGGWGGRGRAMDQTAVEHCQYRHNYFRRENKALQMPNPWRRKLHRPENIQTHEKWLLKSHGNRPELPSPRNKKMPQMEISLHKAIWKDARYTKMGHFLKFIFEYLLAKENAQCLKKCRFFTKGIKNARLATLQQAEFPDFANNLALKIRCKR